jgi:hypothetical protein
MKTIRINLFVLVLMAIAIISGCKKDDDKPASDYVKPSQGSSETLVTVPTTLQNSTDPNAAMVNTYAQMVNAFSGYSEMLSSIPDNATQSELKTTGKSWTWSDGQGNTVWIEFTKDDVKYAWNLYMKTASMSSRKLVVSATQLLTGMAGTMNIYNFYDASTTAVVSYDWAKSADGTTTVNLLFNGGDDAIFFTLVSKADGSGSYKAYKGTTASGIKFIEATWTANGHGTWWIKDTSSGAETSGTF